LLVVIVVIVILSHKENPVNPPERFKKVIISSQTILQPSIAMNLLAFQTWALFWLVPVAAMNMGMAQDGGGYHHGDGGHHNDWAPDNADDSFPYGGESQGRHYCRDNDDFFNRDAYWTNLTTCDKTFSCPLSGYHHYHHYYYDDNDNNAVTNGTFVCRTTYHPITGEPFERVRCIPTDRAWDTDVCGCCGGESCPDLSNRTAAASCLDQFTATEEEEDDIMQFALGTSDLDSSSQYSTDSGAIAASTSCGLLLSVLIGLEVSLLVLT
jgi:hypothetical protein